MKPLGLTKDIVKQIWFTICLESHAIQVAFLSSPQTRLKQVILVKQLFLNLLTSKVSATYRIG